MEALRQELEKKGWVSENSFWRKEFPDSILVY